MITYSKRLFILFLLIIPVVILSSCSTHNVVQPRVDTAVYKPEPIYVPDRHAIYHSVAPGETLWRIAKMYEVDIETIKTANNIRNVRDIEIGTKLHIPKAAPRKHVLTMYPSRKWKYIVVHHSATDVGNSSYFNEAHKKRGWKGVGYHFIIDNGTCGKDDGQIETSPRWIQQESGAHCKAGGMNDIGIGICLVGNFSEDGVSRKQMDSLVFLTKKLKSYYKIPNRNILGHSQVAGAQTECPGTKFPWSRFKRKIN